MLKKLRSLIRHHLGTEELLALAHDLHAAEVFHDRIIDSAWFTHRQLSPGNYAADYGLLKTLYNILSSMKPRNILEFGLGQSSKLVHQYAEYFHASAVTCENSDEWISFFIHSESPSTVPEVAFTIPSTQVFTDSSLGYPLTIRRIPLAKIKVHGIVTTSYKDTETIFSGQRFDFILVDGPYAEEHYSRPQIISLAEQNLADSFCILIDDSQRKGEQETISEVEKVLARRNIPFVSATLSGSKSHTLIVSPSLRFLTTT